MTRRGEGRPYARFRYIRARICAAEAGQSQALGGNFNPVHVYLLVQQGVHILEFNNLERLAADRVYEFAYILTTNAIRGTVAGTALRPLALR